MATNKIATNNDYTATWNQAYPNSSRAASVNLAQTQADVDNETIRDRLWNAFDFAYGQQRRASDEQFANQIGQQNRNMVSRGMQRSSYGAATEANMRNKQVQAQNDIYGQQIAAYEQALLNVEQQEREQENWQKEFDENVRQFNIIHGIGTGGGGGGGGGGSSSSRSGSGNNKQLKTEADIAKALKDKLGNSGNGLADIMGNVGNANSVNRVMQALAPTSGTTRKLTTDNKLEYR